MNRYDQLTQKIKPITGKANVSCANCCRVIGVEYVSIFDFILNSKLLESDLNSITLYNKINLQNLEANKNLQPQISLWFVVSFVYSMEVKYD